MTSKHKLQKEIDSLQKEIDSLQQEISRLIKERDNNNESHIKVVKSLESNHKIKIQEIEAAIRLKENNIESQVYAETKKLRESVQKLEFQNNELKAENKVLKNAFENMGFDVKDMKDILDKLVDGVVSKNTVNVVK